MQSTSDIRQSFLTFFSDKDHQVVDSSPLVPGNDPTLLFTNAGMVQFKETFLGQEKRAYTKATSVQRCVRAGGKHNDLENVGYTARHHTFFEMLGNFSFGDYFKREAIQYAWEYLTQVLQLPEDKLWVTVYKDDSEAEDIWLKEMKIDPARFSRLGEKDNFWSMGDTGPCGPCTEIFYDHGEQVAGGPPGSPDEDGDRYIEIWNLVFMQFDRDAEGKMTPLPSPSVDTGMGLERLAAILQGGHSNYDIDLFQNLIKAVAKLANISDLENVSLKVIADHIRSCAFLIVDGVVPSNEGRGYVLRRIIRRAIRHGHKLGVNESFFYKLVAPLCKEMGDAYPELAKVSEQVTKVLRTEEERFAETLEHGMKVLETSIADLKDSVIPGETIFKLYDTYGFPFDLTGDIARERNLTLDSEGFECEMNAQRERARAAGKFGAVVNADALDFEGDTIFTGYEELEDSSAVMGLFVDGQAVEQISKGDEAIIVLARTPFYAESGGQVGDHGYLRADDSDAVFEVSDTQKQGAGIFTHIGSLQQGSLKVGDSVNAEVNQSERLATALNHSATHLMHAALRKVLGEHVQQKGSLVDAERLRFDFAHFEPMTHQQLAEVEDMVNTHIRANHDVETNLMGLEEARESGAMALFGEKYTEEVRVLRMSDFSVELCGGIHATRTGDIGLFKITNETGTAAGIRRIEGVTGSGALQRVNSTEAQLDGIAGLLKSSRDDADAKVKQLLEKQKKLEKELAQLKGKLASSAGSDLASQAVEVDGIQVLAAKLDGADSKALRDTVDQLKNKLGTAAVVLGSASDGKVALIAGVSKDAMHRVKAGDLVNSVAQLVGGRGGGRPDMAQAGGNDPAALDNALSGVVDWVKAHLDS